MRGLYVLTICLVALFPFTSGCASIPSEAPELSTELGKRISAIEDANITLLNRYFDLKRKEMDKFIEDEWIPLFAKNLFSKPNTSRNWEIVVRENDPNQRLQFIIRTGTRLQETINKKCLELIQPLDDLERRIEKNIRAEYAQARSINNSITSFLYSASEISETRSRYLEMVGVTDESVGNIIDKTDAVISEYLMKAKGAADKIDTAKEYLKKIKSIEKSM